MYPVKDQLTGNSACRLVLGTAQLGMRYGIVNSTGVPDSKEAMAIVQAAWEGGIRQFDTAQKYGISEQVLGQVFTKLSINNEAEVITKLDPTLNHLDESSLRIAVEKSCKNLNVENLFGVLLHREDLLDLVPHGLGKILCCLHETKLIKHLGVSVYSPHRAVQAMNYEIIDIIQIPANVFDRRFLNANFLEFAKSNSKQIYVRSVFLQGLLLKHIFDIPKNMINIVPYIKILTEFCERWHISSHDLTLNYIKHKFNGAHIIFGAETVGQVKENLKKFGKDIPGQAIEEADTVFRNIPESICNPNLWAQNVC